MRVVKDHVNKIKRNIDNGWSAEGIGNCLKVLNVSIPNIVYTMSLVGEWWQEVEDTDERHVLDWLLEHKLLSKTDRQEIAEGNFGTKFSCYSEFYPDCIYAKDTTSCG
jgi:hypothetical protein